MEILAIFTAFILLVAGYLGYRLFRLGSRLGELKSSFELSKLRLSDELAKNEKLEQGIKNSNSALLTSQKETVEFRTKFEEQKARNEELKARQDELDVATRKYFELKTEQMSQNLLNLNTTALSKNSQKILEDLINPLKIQIEKYQKESINTNTVFKTNFENLKNETKSIVEQSKNLAEALKGNKKSLGNWGEIQLESVLGSSGLELGKHYFKQVAYKDKEGKQKFLDLVVKFDENKKAIIDSKCSLVNYSAYFNEEDEGKKKEFAKLLAKDMKNHIENLSSKEYQDYDKTTYEYVFMFVPNDAIFYTALNEDSSIYEFAYEKGIFITTPLTLLMALKTVYICWRNLKSDENAMQILSQAGSIYDKFAGFVDKFDKLKNQLNTANNTFEDCEKTLNSGKGNLIGKFESLKKLGLKNTKNISKEYEEDQSQIVETLELG